MKKIFWILLFFIAFLSAICVWRWNVWFYEPSEALYEAPEGPSYITMTCGQDAVHSRIISWRTANEENAMLILSSDKNKDTLYAKPLLVASEGGEQYWYKVHLDSLQYGQYSYSIHTSLAASKNYTFSIQPVDSAASFLLFGDILLADSALPLASIVHSASAHPCSPLAAVLYTGNIVEYRDDYCWSTWFASMQGEQAVIPQLSSPGHTDYSRGFFNDIDPRWMQLFSCSNNGPERFIGRTFYIDYPLARIFFLDTESLLHLADYTVLQTWLKRHLQEEDNRWKIVVMHHPVHSAAVGRDHIRLYFALHRTLDGADLIFSGNDRTYARRADLSLKDYILEQHSLPVYVVTTATTTQEGVNKVSPLDQRIGTSAAFFEYICLTADSCWLTTHYLHCPDSIYDALAISRNSSIVQQYDSLPKEVIEYPDSNYFHLKARRFEHIRASRLERSK